MISNSMLALLELAAAILIWGHTALTCSYLKRAHRSVWVALGEPSVGSPAIGSARMLRFIW